MATISGPRRSTLQKVATLLVWVGCALALTSCDEDWECGERCMVGGACVEGECVCGPDLQVCYYGGGQDQCVDTFIDPFNCGSCGRECAQGRSCDNGRCQPCGPGEDECSVPGNDRPICADTSASLQHCGSCGTQCPGGVDCIGGQCTLVCEEGLDFCLTAAACVDFQSDDLYCGDCETACPVGTTCREGACSCDDEALALCGGACVDTRTDAAHCGDCDTACPEMERCVGGLCVCEEGQRRCDGVCSDVSADPLNCGACDNACGRDFVCVQSTCLCPEPGSSCGEICINLGTSTELCGDCETSCDPGSACASGECAAVADIAVGVGTACGVLEDGRAMCWGRNDAGQCARGPSAEPVERPALSRFLGGEVSKIALGEQHGCARKSDGTVWCWGEGAFGQLGDGRTDPGAPAPIPDLTDAVDIEAGGNHTCVRKDDGSVLCWGLGRAGQIPGGQDIVLIPTALELVEPAVSIHLGPATTCVLVAEARPGCTGELALGTIPGEKPRVADMAVGNSHGCLLYEGGAVACWGANDQGQGGVEGFDDLPTVVDVAGVGTASDVVVGDAFSCVLLEADGGVACWGSNARGQLAQDALVGSNTPLVINLPAATLALRAGPDFACALGADGITRCWGAGDTAQLGRGGPLEDDPDPAGVRW
jgi:hypothetical protein